jgi:hypothetical protein
MVTDLMALGVLVLSVVATFRVARRRSGTRGGPAGSGRPVGRGGSLDFVTAGQRVSRSNRRILAPARTVRAYRRHPANRAVTVTIPAHVAPAPGGPSYV